ncbi:MAG: class I SAM-dependent methyltransferase, partial [Bacteroidetes bacterium]|nr:class I SAM-dependent methyltransferase [Bacteroidota bacterium]
MNTCIACGNDKFELLLKSKDFCVSKEDFNIVKCTNCGFALTENAPDEKHIGSYYEHEDYISHSDTSKGLIFKIYHWVRNIMLKRKLGYIRKHKNIQSLLDVGAGTAYFVNYLRESGIEAIGVEPDSGARKQAKDNFNIDLLEGLTQVDFSQRKFDAISMWHVLEHVHQLDEYFLNFNSFLKENGLLVIAVPNYTSLDANYYKEFWAAYDLPKHLWHFSPQS